MTQPPRALIALGEVAGRLVRTTPSGKVVLARTADLVTAGMVPAELREDVVSRLADARSQVEPLPFKQIEKQLKTAWGKPAGKVLDDLDEEPLSVRAGAQVHRATYDDRAVAVKVIRPGLPALVRADLVALDALAGPLNSLFPGTDAGGMLRVAREMALEELDLEHEAGQQRQARRALRALEEVVVPETITDLAAPQVLVSELLEGPTLEEAEPDDPLPVAQAVLDAHVLAWRHGGVAMMDPRPGHVVLLRDGRIGLLGTGVARRADPARAGAVLAALAALRDDDPDGFADATGELGVLSPGDGRDAHRLAAHLLGDLVTGPARLDEAALAEAGERLIGRLGVFLRLGAKATPDPEDLAPFRMIGQLAALLARLGATEHWADRATVRP